MGNLQTLRSESGMVFGAPKNKKKRAAEAEENSDFSTEESAGLSDVEFVDGSDAVNKNRNNPRAKRQKKSVKQIIYNPEKPLTDKQKRKLTVNQLNDYHIQIDDHISWKRGQVGKRAYAKRMGFANGVLPKNFKTPAQKERLKLERERKKPKKFINN